MSGAMKGTLISLLLETKIKEEKDKGRYTKKKYDFEKLKEEWSKIGQVNSKERNKLNIIKIQELDQFF